MPFAYGVLASKPLAFEVLAGKRPAYGALTCIHLTFGVSVNKKCVVY